MSVSAEIPSQLGRARFHGHCEIGAFSYFGGCADVYHASIGRYVSIADGVRIGAGEHPIDRFTTHPLSWGGGRSRFPMWKYTALAALAPPLAVHKRTVIGSDVWIGADVIIRQGCRLADGCIVAAGSVVTRNVDAFCIVAGVPARPIRQRLEEVHVQRLQALAWWTIDLAACGLTREAFTDPGAFCDALESYRDNATALPMLAPRTRIWARQPWRRRLRLP